MKSCFHLNKNTTMHFSLKSLFFLKATLHTLLMSLITDNTGWVISSPHTGTFWLSYCQQWQWKLCMQMTFHVINTISGHLGGTYREIEKVNDNLKAYLKIVCSNYNYLLYCFIFLKNIFVCCNFFMHSLFLWV